MLHCQHTNQSIALIAQASEVPVDDMDDATLLTTLQALQAALARRGGLKLVSLQAER